MKLDIPLLAEVLRLLEESMQHENAVAGWCDETNQIMVMVVAKRNANALVINALASSMLADSTAKLVVGANQQLEGHTVPEPERKM